MVLQFATTSMEAAGLGLWSGLDCGVHLPHAFDRLCLGCGRCDPKSRNLVGARHQRRAEHGLERHFLCIEESNLGFYRTRHILVQYSGFDLCFRRRIAHRRFSTITVYLLGHGGGASEFPSHEVEPRMSFEALYQSGNIAYIILALMLGEAVLLSRFFKRLPGLLTGLIAGACFVLALRAALLQQHWTVIGSFLALAFVFHVTEVWQWLRLTKTQP